MLFRCFIFILFLLKLHIVPWLLCFKSLNLLGMLICHPLPPIVKFGYIIAVQSWKRLAWQFLCGVMKGVDVCLSLHSQEHPKEKYSFRTENLENWSTIRAIWERDNHLDITTAIFSLSEISESIITGQLLPSLWSS